MATPTRIMSTPKPFWILAALRVRAGTLLRSARPPSMTPSIGIAVPSV